MHKKPSYRINENQPTQKSQTMSVIVNGLNKKDCKACNEKISKHGERKPDITTKSTCERNTTHRQIDTCRDTVEFNS